MSDHEKSELARKAEALYESRLRAPLEAAHRDEFLAIEPESGDYFLGSNYSDAIQASRRAHPDRLYYCLRIGHKAAVEVVSSTL